MKKYCISSQHFFLGGNKRFEFGKKQTFQVKLRLTGNYLLQTLLKVACINISHFTILHWNQLFSSLFLDCNQISSLCPNYGM